MISSEKIEEVIKRADIVDVIGGYVQLKKSGANFIACCPFHGEKTPSFHVSPARQAWYCFGACQEGGNVIGFIMRQERMTFPEAVKMLARRYGIDVEDAPENPADLARRLKREALLGLNARVADWFVQNLRSKNYPAAWENAVSRWGEKYVQEAGVGYAPADSSALYEWALARGERKDYLLELDLLKKNERNGSIYSAFRDRLVIPIRDRQRNVIGFTCRDLSGLADVPKYMNSSESEIYHKRETLFGLDVAWKQAAQQDLIFLVEGAADAMKMHSVGIDNVCAPLGGAWSPEQFSLIRKITKNVCFINDADPVPAGKKYGTGIGFVIKNGRTALDCRMNVSVRELPCAEGNVKQDPGDFFTGKNKLDLLQDEDFIVWVAGKITDKADSVQDKQRNIPELASLCALIEDDMRVELVITELNKIYKGKEMWRAAVNKIRWDEKNEKEKKDTGVNLRDYGFYEEYGSYFGITERGDTVQWANFTMRPLFLIKDADAPRRLFAIKRPDRKEEIVELTMEELTSVAKLKQKLEGMGNYIFMGCDKELTKLKIYLYDQTEAATRVRMMGWHNDGFYVFGNGAYNDGQFFKADEYGICRLGKENYYLPSASSIYAKDAARYEFEKKFVHLGVQQVNFASYMQDFVSVYGENGMIGLCYLVASLFRDIITGHLRYFPNLDLFGPKGSGKSEFGQALMSFFVIDNKPANINTATLPALGNSVANVANALVHLDEYKNDIDPKKVEFLKGLYDGVGRTKMGGASYEDIKMTSVKSGIIISGQEIPTADIALFHRCVFLPFTKSEFSEAETQRYRALQEVMKRGITNLTLQVLDFRNKFEASFSEIYKKCFKEVSARLDFNVETRIIENWVKCLAAFCTLEDVLPWPMEYKTILGLCLSGIERQNKMSNVSNEVSNFWRVAVYMRDDGKIFEGGDFRIEKSFEVKTDILEREFKSPRRLLFLNTSKIFFQYRRAAIQMGITPLPEDSLREYLKNSPPYLGTKKSVRFREIIDGHAVSVENPTPGGMNFKNRIQRAMVFDYEMLYERDGISLHSSYHGQDLH